KHIVVVDRNGAPAMIAGAETLSWGELIGGTSGLVTRSVIDTDPAAIMYTSGSTGRPKGVVLSHRNLLDGARSVVQYMENSHNDRILSVLPLSFDAGLSQLTTAFLSSATCVLLNYATPADVVATCRREHITGITGVPPLWHQLASVNWPGAAREALRYF